MSGSFDNEMVSSMLAEVAADAPPALKTVLGVVAASPFPMFVLLGPERKIAYNEAYAHVIGARHPAAFGKPFFDVWPNYRDTFGPVADRAFAGEASHFENMPVRITRTEQETAWFTFAYSPIRDEAGSVLAALCVCTETTEFMRARRRQNFLINLESSFRGFSEPLDIVKAAQSALGQHLGVSRVGYGSVEASERYFTTEENWTDGSVPSHSGTHDLAAFGEEIFRSLREGISLAVDDTLTDPRAQDASAAAAFAALQVRSAATVSLIKGGRFVAALYVHHHQPRRWTTEELALVQDVAERTWAAVERAHADAAVRELNATLEQRVAAALAERRLFAELVEMTDAPIQLIDKHFRFLALNPAAVQDYERVFGVRPEVGQSLHDVLGELPQQRDAAVADWSRALAGESFNQMSWWGDGEQDRRAYEMRFRPLYDSDGTLHGAYLLGRDVTDLLREQERVAKAEDQLRQAQKMEAMGQLTGGVAHDFNNLLTPIVGSLSVLQRNGVGNEREQRMIAGAAQAADRARILVQRLLAFARRQPLQPSAVDIGAVAQGMAGLIASTVGPQIHISVEAEAGLPAAHADPNQLEMALLNLAVNARDAMPDGGTLRISAQHAPAKGSRPQGLAAGDYLRLSVADTGSGMDAETLKRAVEPFFSTKGIGKGTGLGLSMVHGLASQLGGALAIESHPGVGTNVTLWLPVSRETPMQVDERAIGAAAGDRRGLALLVDDEELVRSTTAEMLRDLGYDVEEASSAQEALAKFRQVGKVDLLVTDHLMPGMTGTELARTLLSGHPAIRVLIVSGYSNVDDVAPDLPRLAKPFGSQELARALSL